MKHSKYIGKYSHGSSLHYISLLTGFLQVKQENIDVTINERPEKLYM